ncbi:glycosyltransferase family 4 protein [Pelagibacteraceae bacterium]|jgi:phosphatidylinositol alpha-1,6-mannosyltransferase|nr:glycosyltransferase family 4 protein [Pelagibacteraceae bacterium]
MFVITTRSFPPEVGGMQTLLGDLAHNLAKHGKVQVFADSADGDSDFDNQQFYRIERIKGFKFLQKYRKKNQVEIFCGEQKDTRALIADHWKSIEKVSENLCKKIPTLCLIHGKDINQPLRSLRHTRMLNSLKKTKYIIANSQFTKKLAIEKGIPSNKIKVINPGITAPLKTDSDAKAQALELFGNTSPKLISVTRLERRKGLHSVILSLKNLQAIHPNFLYLIVGEGEQEEDLRSITSHMDLETNVIFLGDVREELKNALLEAADIFLMPSIEDKASVEGFGISFLEASCFKTPSIGGLVGGAADIIKNNQTGLLCDGTDHDAIYNCLQQMLKNDKHLEMGQAAKEYSKQFYWDNQIQKYLQLI